MIRTVFVWFCIAVGGAIVGSLCIICYPFNPSGRLNHYMAGFWGKIALWANGVKVRVEGLEHIPGKGPYVFMSNHQGSYDIFALLGHLPFQFKWLAKKEMFSIPILGLAMKATGYIFIDREGTRETVKAMKSAAEKIQEGMSVVIFPEGSRSPDGSIQPFKKGGFTLAIKSKVPIVPVAIIGSGEIIRKGKLRVYPGSITIRLDSPIETKGCTMKDRRALMDQLHAIILENFRLISKTTTLPDWRHKSGQLRNRQE
jgi:1-acyl-sn-glycerol-3-phosphate acyltransferase